MANFHTHVTTSTLLGVGYAGAGLMFGAPPAAALVAGGMCGVAGMLPDLDSDSGIPLRETMAFMAAVVPMLLMDRFTQFGLGHEEMVLAGGSIYLLVRFGVAWAIKRYTVHRGMFHSIPAALVFAGIGFLICGCDNMNLRYYKAGAIFLGFMSHLLLDELYSIEWYRGRLRLKRSSGTAIKFWGDSLWANLSVYVKLAIVVGMIMSEPLVMDHFGVPEHHDIYHSAEQLFDDVLRR